MIGELVLCALVYTTGFLTHNVMSRRKQKQQYEGVFRWHESRWRGLVDENMRDKVVFRRLGTDALEVWLKVSETHEQRCCTVQATHEGYRVWPEGRHVNNYRPLATDAETTVERVNWLLHTLYEHIPLHSGIGRVI